jgi:hypothetical protein
MVVVYIPSHREEEIDRIRSALTNCVRNETDTHLGVL